MMMRVIAVLVALSLSVISTHAHGESISEVLKRVKRSVVIIKAKQHMATKDKQLATAHGLGSGFLISEDGKIMTAAHVVQTAYDIEVIFHDGQSAPAKVIASEPAADVALLKVTKMPKSAVVATLGNSEKVQVGEQVFIVGAPYGLSYTLTVGHISARHKPSTLAGEMTLAEFFQTDAAVNQGNSGGPMFNMKGEVIGIVSHILSQSGGFEGLGFVATSKTATELLLIRKSFWSGMEGLMLEDELADIFNLPQKRGVLIQRIAMGSPASRIGLREGTIPAKIGDRKMLLGGDILLAFNGISIAEKNGYIMIKKHISELKDGSTVTIKILRAGVIRDLNATFKR